MKKNKNRSLSSQKKLREKTRETHTLKTQISTLGKAQKTKLM